MDLHFFSKLTSALGSISKVTGATSATQEVAFSTRNEKSNEEREVPVNKVTRPAAGIMTDVSTLTRLPSSLPGLDEDHDGLDYYPLCTASCYLNSQDPTLVYLGNYGW